MQRLYNLGARKFVITGLGIMGCIPSILAQSPLGQCSDSVNELVQPFNNNVKTMIDNLNVRLPGSKFIYVDIASIFQDILARPAAYGTYLRTYLCNIPFSFLFFSFLSLFCLLFNFSYTNVFEKTKARVITLLLISLRVLYIHKASC